MTYKELVGGGNPKALGSRSSVMKTIIFLGRQFFSNSCPTQMDKLFGVIIKP